MKLAITYPWVTIGYEEVDGRLIYFERRQEAPFPTQPVWTDNFWPPAETDEPDRAA